MSPLKLLPCSRDIAKYLLGAAGWLMLASLALAQQPEAKSSRDRIDPNVAGNAEVEKILKTFAGRGEVGDDSQPTAAPDALKLFQLVDGVRIELIDSEPNVMQPLYISFDPQGRMWVVQYLQYPFPAGLKVVRYDQHLRAVFDDVPRPPPHHVHGQDKITVWSDTNGDGKYDAHQDVITGLNITSAALVGRGGIWVLNPPYLLFYPDANGDGIPDGDPQVKLSGFGLQDTHSVANSLAWGPDGWLYGANGSTTTAKITSKGSQEVGFEGQCIWRFQPDSEIFEVFAEGGGNTFSLEIDNRGRVFSGTNGGNTRGMFYLQGSYGVKNWGKHGPLTNPYAFGFFEHMKHEGDTVRFPQTFVIYEGGTLPQRYQGNVIAANALHNRVWASELIPQGSTYRTIDMPAVCTTSDRWFRPVDVKVGPDGAVYLADWYDTRLTHVDPRDNWHKTSGRLYRLQGTNVPDEKATNLSALSDDQLIDRFAHANKWQRQTAVRVLGERLRQRPGDAARRRLLTMCRAAEPQALEALWTLHLIGAFDETLAVELLRHPDEDVRRWAVRLLGDDRNVAEATGRALADMAGREPHVQVRSQLASSSKRFETAVALPILRALLAREEDQYDTHMPLLIWWGLEAHCGAEELRTTQQVGTPLTPWSTVPPRQQVLQFFNVAEAGSLRALPGAPGIPGGSKPVGSRPSADAGSVGPDRSLWDQKIVKETVLARLMRRFAMEGGIEPGEAGLAALEVCKQLLDLAPAPEHRQILMSGFLEAYQGREIAKLPPDLKRAIDDYQASLGKSDLVLGVRLGQADAIKKALATIRDESADAPVRLTLMETFGQIDVPQSVPVLLNLLRSPSSAIQKAALQALTRYSDPDIGKRICEAYQNSLTDENGQREAAQRVLASRPEWTSQFLAEIEQFRIRSTSVPPEIIQQLRLHQDPALQERVNKLFGRTRAAPEEKLQDMQRWRKFIASSRGPKAAVHPDAGAGRALFKQHCGQCHTLFGEGGAVGPNLTGYERSNLDFLILAVVDPSAAIREEFTQYQIVTTDGRVLTGLIVDQTPTTVSLRAANGQTSVLARGEIDVLQATPISLMPEGLLPKMTEQQVADLFAYLMQPTPGVTPAAAN